jgi:uncharacterized protein YndB with AHSA1/START domain
MSDAVRAAVDVPLAPDRAFSVFTAEIGEWWPPEYTWSQAKLEGFGIEPREGGLCFERGPFGFRCDWGRVTAWEPPARLAFLWQIGPTRAPEPDPDRASEVEARFTAHGDLTAVELSHARFERHGDGAEGYRAGMGSPRGWAHILERFAERARRAG